AREHQPLQAWLGECTWIPLFDQADCFRCTVYEDASVLNWFRGILLDDHGLHREKMTAPWCANVLRMVAPRMWLCRSLFEQVDRTALETVAQISERNGSYKVTLIPGRTLAELELALLPILPVESARIRPAR